MSKEGDKLGGSESKSTYKIKDTVPSYNKGGHKERSIANQPNHKKFWRKVNIFRWKKP